VKQKKGRYLPAEKLPRPREMKITPTRAKWRLCLQGANFDIRERSNLSLLRRPSASCEGSPLGDPAAVEAAADSGRDEEKKAGKKGTQRIRLNGSDKRSSQKIRLSKCPLKRSA
jgi:hypothetical protein